jgi:tRNA pseudouridine38-40 synthase
MTTQRWKLTVEYDGSPFVGWQWQENGMSVQQALEEALFKLTGQEIRTTAAGRTDAGVHARGQVVHCDVPKNRDAKAMSEGLNFHLKPHPVAVLQAEMVPDSFSARMSAVERSYCYRIINRAAPLTFEQNRAWWVARPLKAKAMHEAAQALIGTHDFTSFRAAECQAKSPLKTLDEFKVEQDGEEIRCYVRARSFLHHQVRNMVGTLALVGAGKWSKADVATALAACNRASAGPTAPACGLYFMAVKYTD